jgi:23S rRNA pseudouridine2605 synthase
MAGPLHYDIHGKTFSARSSASRPWFGKQPQTQGILNQQQLQIARAALWHQTAAPAPAAGLLTFEDAAHWLEDIGLCLFLPRHTQIPAPAPSLVEACQGAASVTPPPAAIALATEFATRLIDERRAIPLNLLGTFSEQPDFLITTDVLPWVAAVRGDRQWKAAPAGRTAPIVVRAWEALDREGEKTAIEIREILGREVTEAAVLRALVELWTTLRAAPAYTDGQPARWSLLKNRYPAQLTTGGNTAQTTALSALLSIYLRSAVAATAEEAEVFLSPLTARSRIREVVHGMMATRQLGTMSVASQTLLFVEGSLPEHAPEPEPPIPHETPAGPQRVPFKKEPRPTRWELPPQEAHSERDRPRGPWQKKPPAANRFSPSADRPGRGPKPFGRPRTGPGPASG